MSDTEINNSPVPEADKEPDKTERQTENKKRPTRGRPARETPEPPKWQIRGVEMDTRALIEKAAKAHSKTLGEFFNQEIREYCAGQVKKSKQPPAAPQDIENIISAQIATQFGTMQESLLQQITERMKQEMAQQQPEAEPKGFWARLFNK